MTSTIETWELSSLTHKLENMNGHLQKLLTICRQHLGNEFDLTTRFSNSTRVLIVKMMKKLTLSCFSLDKISLIYMLGNTVL